MSVLQQSSRRRLHLTLVWGKRLGCIRDDRSTHAQRRMSASCCPPSAQDSRFRRVLWIALVVNLSMFLIEALSGIGAQSTALLADAADFLGDAANYAMSLLVLPLGMLWRARAAFLKGLSMAAYGVGILIWTAYSIHAQQLPDAHIMGVVGVLAFISNFGVAVLLYRFRQGDSNMRSVWLCTRNDAIGNLAVIAAAVGVFGTGSGWPDYVVALIMATLALSASVTVLRQARAEIRGDVLSSNDSNHIGHGH